MARCRHGDVNRQQLRLAISLSNLIEQRVG
jgi:hypothetical protein